MSQFARDVVSIFTFLHFSVVLEKMAEFVEKFIGAFWFCAFDRLSCCRSFFGGVNCGKNKVG